MNKNTIQLTQGQYDAMVARKREIIEVERPRIAEQIDIARGFGDLSENAEYQAAKDEQGKVETELKIIENNLKYAVIIKKNKSSDLVCLGSIVRIKELSNGKEYTITIIGQDGDGVNEVDVRSKLGEALYNQSLGTVVRYESNEATPVELAYEILEIN